MGCDPSCRDYPAEKKVYTRSFRIIGLGEDSRKVFEFKRLIRKVFRNKDLGLVLGLLTLAKY